jgi:hypothetical protein
MKTMIASFCAPRAAGTPRTVTRRGPPARGKVAEALVRKLFPQLNGYICMCGHNPPRKR